MTDRVCPAPNCPGVPLMAKGSESFCAKCVFPQASIAQCRSHMLRFELRCDGSPDAKSEPLLQPLNGSNESLPTSQSSASLRSRLESGLSTPPTPNSTLPADPPFPAFDLATLQARRQQSDRASQEIGQLLLKGWMLLGDECPNASCHGIPLMKRPTPRPSQKEDGSQESKHPGIPRDPRKFCVICHQNFVGERELAEFNAATAELSAAAKTVTAADESAIRGSSKRRYDDEAIQTLRRPLAPPPAKRKGGSSDAPPPPPVQVTAQVLVASSFAADFVVVDPTRCDRA
jgi:uncharacterized Zn finger protein (UPF0148 family)